MPLCKFQQVWQARHGAVVVHDFADDARRNQPREAGDIDRCLGMPGAHEHAALARFERENMARACDIVRLRLGVDGGADGVGAVGRADAGGHALARFDGNGEGSGVAAAVVARHGGQAEALDLCFLEREADEPACVPRHVIDRIRIAKLGGDDEVALVLAVFVIHQDDHAPGARFGDNIFDGGELGHRDFVSAMRAT